MIYFITNEPERHHVYRTDDITILSGPIGMLKVSEYLYDNPEQASIDTETTGLDPYMNELVLTIIGDDNVQFVIDNTSGVIMDEISGYQGLWLAHNMKFDYSMLLVNEDIELKNLYCTMIAHQRLFQNVDIPASLDYITSSYLGITLDKEVRSSFIDFNITTGKLTRQQVEYGSKDVKHLAAIKGRQVERIEKFNMYLLLYKIEFPLIKVLADMELEGFVMNEDKWVKLLAKNEEESFEVEVKMDAQVRGLRDTIASDKDKIYLKNGAFDRERIKHPKSVQVNIFGEENEVKYKHNQGNTNYNSTKQLLYIFEHLNIELPSKDGYDYSLPSEGDVTTGAKEMEAYVIERPNNPAIDFIESIVKYREYKKEISTYGEAFLNKINPKTNKLHTIFRQCATANSRLASGGGKNQKDRINIQNIPAKKERRECFGTDPNYKIITCDLSGAEVTIMASKAQDFRLLELSGTDIHSHMAQTGWRNIFYYRLGQELSLWNNPKQFWDKKERYSLEVLIDICDTPLTKDLYYQASHFQVSKTIRKDSHRKPCKNLTFGAVYGARAKKAGKTINVSQDEGQIYITTIKKEIPATFKMVEKSVSKAKSQGYLVLNDRTNSRIFFEPVLKAKQEGREIDYTELRLVDGPARNIPISGTQADILKEGMVEIYNYFRFHNLNAKIIGQVHDELIVKAHKTIAPRVAKIVEKIMTDTANLYLEGVEMGADYEVLDTWTK